MILSWTLGPVIWKGEGVQMSGGHFRGVQVVRSILTGPEEGTGSIERQAAHAKALVMLAKVHKVWTCPSNPVLALSFWPCPLALSFCLVPRLPVAQPHDIPDWSRSNPDL